MCHLAARLLRPLVVVSLLALGVAGCGQSDDREAVRATTQQFLAAYAADRDEAACQRLAPTR